MVLFNTLQNFSYLVECTFALFQPRNHLLNTA